MPQPGLRVWLIKMVCLMRAPAAMRALFYLGVGLQCWARIPGRHLRKLATDLDGYLKGVTIDVRRDGKMGKMTDDIFNQRYARFFEPRIAIEETGAVRKHATWLLFALQANGNAD
jgi:hypothetical protein